MAVPRNKQSLAETEYYHNGVIMRDRVMDLLIRDFGLKIENWNVKDLKNLYSMTDEDIKTFVNLFKKYHVMEHLLFEYPNWLITYMRENIMDYLKIFMVSLRMGDSIEMRSDYAYEKRRYHFIKAKTACEMIADDLSYIERVLPVSSSHYLDLLDSIDFERRLLTRVLKRDGDKFHKWQRRKHDSEYGRTTNKTKEEREKEAKKKKSVKMITKKQASQEAKTQQDFSNVTPLIDEELQSILKEAETSKESTEKKKDESIVLPSLPQKDGRKREFDPTPIKTPFDDVPTIPNTPSKSEESKQTNEFTA